MSKKHFLIASLIFSSSGLIAQQDSSVKQLDEVVITGNRFPVKQSQTGKVIIVIDHVTIEKSPGKSLGQLLTEQAGIVVNGSLNAQGTNQSVYLRGAAVGRTLITIDGIPVNDPSLIENEFDINLIPLESVEKIEICKGAQSTLYGSDAIAGVINIITIKPGISSALNAKLTASAGNYGTYKVSPQIFGSVLDKFIYNIRYTHNSTNGFSAAYDSTGKGSFDKDGYKSDVLASNIAWSATDQLTIKTFVQYSRYRAGIDQSAFTDAIDYTNTSKNLMLGGGFVYKLSNTTLNGNYLYSTSNRILHEDSVLFQGYYDDHYYGKTQYVELFASTVLGAGFTWLNGADYRFASMNEHGLSGNFPLAFRDTSLSQTSMYSSLFYSGKSGINAELGGRLNTHSRYGSNYTYTINPSYVLSDRLKIYASVASGFKAPSLYQLYSDFSGNQALLPEKSTSYELGMQFSNQIYNTRLTYFYRKTKDGLDYNYITNQYFNFNHQTSQGIEFEDKFEINKMFGVSLNYTWTKTSEGIQSRVTYKDTSYNYALRRPEHVINLTLSVQPLKALYISLSGHFESKRFDIGGYDFNFNPLPDVLLKSFFTLGGYAEYRFPKMLRLFVDAKNITNQKFFTLNGYNSIPFMIAGGVSINISK